MRFALPLLLCLGITVICVQARKQCRARGSTNTAPTTSNFRSFLAVLPPTTTKPAAAKPKVVAKPVVKPKVVAKAKPKVVAKAKPKAVAKPKPKGRKFY
uniref:Histone H1 n=1 Tax=Panagrellus redivivus TaxID=6233 RepID=A0A7E4VN05_PANRE